MGIGIQICGLNGCGKSTIGKELAKEFGFHFIDNESLFFSRTTESEPYTNSRSRSDVEKLLVEEVNTHKNFVFAAVKGDYGEDIISKYKYVIVVEVPKEIRLQRVRNRSFLKFGSRMMPGGDLYDQEESFFQMVESRREDCVESWVQTMRCPVIRVDGTKPIQENLEIITRYIKKSLEIEQQ